MAALAPSELPVSVQAYVHTYMSTFARGMVQKEVEGAMIEVNTKIEDKMREVLLDEKTTSALAIEIAKLGEFQTMFLDAWKSLLDVRLADAEGKVTSLFESSHLLADASENQELRLRSTEGMAKQALDLATHANSMCSSIEGELQKGLADARKALDVAEGATKSCLEHQAVGHADLRAALMSQQLNLEIVSDMARQCSEESSPSNGSRTARSLGRKHSANTGSRAAPDKPEVFADFKGTDLVQRSSNHHPLHQSGSAKTPRCNSPLVTPTLKAFPASMPPFGHERRVSDSASTLQSCPTDELIDNLKYTEVLTAALIPPEHVSAALKRFEHEPPEHVGQQDSARKIGSSSGSLKSLTSQTGLVVQQSPRHKTPPPVQPAPSPRPSSRLRSPPPVQSAPHNSSRTSSTPQAHRTPRVAGAEHVSSRDAFLQTPNPSVNLRVQSKTPRA